MVNDLAIKNFSSFMRKKKGWVFIPRNNLQLFVQIVIERRKVSTSVYKIVNRVRNHNIQYTMDGLSSVYLFHFNHPLSFNPLFFFSPPSMENGRDHP